MTRIEFEVPRGSESGKCRHCKAEILWVPGAKGMMPLDATSAIIYRLESGEQVKRAESHFAHCPAAEKSRRSTPRALCRNSDCGESISRKRFFCASCSKQLPASCRALLRDSLKRYGPQDQRTRDTVARAGALIRSKLEASRVTTGTLFGEAGTKKDDPG